MKAMLKSAGFEGYASEIMAKMEKRHASVDRTSMGNLVNALFDTVFAAPREADGPDEVAEIWLSTKFTIELTDPSARQLRESLEQIVDHRNRLVHQKLAQTDFNSIRSCKELGALLDEQNEMAAPAYRQLHALFLQMQHVRSKAGEYFATEEFENALFGEDELTKSED